MDLRANTAVDVLIGPFVDSTDGNTTEDGLTLSQADIKLSKNGQALAQKTDATAAAFDDDGYYNCELDATDTNTEGNLVLIVHESGALPVRHEYNVMAEAAWDSMYVAKDDGFMDVNIKTVGRADTQETEANNLESACSNYSATRGLTGTAVPAAVADAAGGMPISDAGGLDLDSKLANTNEVTAARMATLTDWINGGRLDLLLDAIPTTAMRGTDNAALASVVGALADAAAAGDPTSADTLMQYLKQLVNVLVGTTGVTTFPAESAPGNNISLAEVLRAIHVDVTGLNGDAMRGTNSANTTVPDAAGTAPTANEIRDAIYQGTLTEGYSADGAAVTLEQGMYEIMQALTEFAIAGTTITVKKRDGSTSAMTFSIDDASDPTSRTRAT